MSWLSVVGNVVGGLIGAGSASRAQDRQNRETRWQNAVDRVLFERDRTYSENYEAERRTDDRAYVDRMVADERRHERASTANERAYERQQYNRTVRDDRAYLERNRQRDQLALNRAEMQRVNTRGVDFQKMREQAIAAGFNPLSVLGTAGMYSTEINQQVVGAGGLSGGVGTGRATPGSGGGGGGGGGSYGGGGTTGAASAGMVGPTGSARSFDPALAGGGFIAEAVSRGIDTVFNTPVQNDPLADALRTALQSDTVVKDYQDKNIRQDFGYDLQKQAPYRPAVNVSGPPMSSGSGAQANARAGTSGSDDMTATSVLPLTIDGRQLQSTGRHSDAEAFESRYGELAGEVAGISALTDDLGKAARDRSMVNKGTPVRFYRKPKLYDWPKGLRPDGYGGFH